MIQPTVIYEDNHLLVVDKPAGIATAGVTDAISVYSWAQGYIKHKYNKPGNVYIGVVSRLDTVTSGVLVLARTSKSAARLSDQLRLHKVEKTYLAVLEGHLDLPISTGSTRSSSLWIDQVYKDDEACRMRVAAGIGKSQRVNQASSTESRQATDGRNVQEAKLSITLLKQFSVNRQDATLVSIQLLTGRKHQIRVQSAARGHAVWGDKKYGAKTDELNLSRNNRGIALHATKLRFEHPTRGEMLEFTVPPPSSWQIFGQILPTS